MMKVTVCFGSVRVVVPCGDGNLLVSELIDKSIVRYKKATGKSHDHWVAVHNLKAADGGILDNDDQLADVADDREQIIALYEEQGGPPLHHNGGDGTSASSVGTSSPDMFHGHPAGEGGEGGPGRPGFRPFVRGEAGGKHDVVITQTELNTGSCLIVRRGSEPVLTNIGNSPNDKKLEAFPASPNKRWSAIANLDDVKIPRDGHDEPSRPLSASTSNGRPPPYPPTYPPSYPPVPTAQPQRSQGSGEERGGGAREGEPGDVVTTDTTGGGVNGFARDSTRRSLANSAAMWQWLEAQENQQIRLQGTDRKEPLGGSGDPEEKENFSPDINAVTVVMKNTRGPLGIHVVPDYREDGSDTGGLVIQGIEPRGRIYQDGRLKVMDKIVEINGTSLKNVQFSKAQELFKQALETPELQLKVLSNDQPPPLPRQPPPLTLPVRTVSGSSTDNHDGAPVEGDAASPPLSPSKKTPPPLPVRAPTTTLTSTGSQGKGKIIAPTNTKRIGRKMLIVLKKGSQGLGFSVTTRDNPAGGVPPIYIKNILPKGAAIEDGRLLSGDRLLEVNNEDVSGKSQSDVVAMLRTTPLSSTVSLVVSRIAQEEDKFSVPREMSDSQTSSPFQSSNLSRNSQPSPSHDALQTQEKSPDEDPRQKEVLSFDIPLSDSGSAGLGVSVKGRTTAVGQKVQDMGIFIKSVISGGAASKDGRLMVNDQLVKVNGENLSGKSNTFAMETLRRAMQKEGPISGKIHLVIARRKFGAENSLESPSSREIRISQSDQGDGQTSTNQNAVAMTTDANANKQNYKDLNGAVNRLASSSLVIGRSVGEGVANSNDSSAVGRLIGENNLIGRSVGFGGGDNNSQKLRNMSYQIATEDTLNQTALEGEPADLEKPTYRMDSPHRRPQGVATKARPASTIGFQQVDTKEETVGKTTRSNENLIDDATRQNLIQKWEKNPDIMQEDGLSPTTEDPGFSREGFGRQSMSEKRKGHVDPRMSEFYQKVKDLRDKRSDQYASETWDPRKSKIVFEGQIARIGSAESLLGSHFFNLQEPIHMHESMYPYAGGKSPGHQQLGPTLGLKKSSSLESLQTAVQEVTLDEEAKKDGILFRSGGNRSMVRGRGCNESFRAAVDRSYEQQEPMETLPISVEEEGESETGSSLGPPETSLIHPETSLGRNNSQASSSIATGEHDLSLSSGGGEDKKKRKNSKKEKKKDRKDEAGNKGIFSGLFKFGKSRKASDPVDDRGTYQKSSPSERGAQAQNSTKPEPDKIQEQQRMLHEKQRQLEVARQREEEHRLREKQQQQPQHSYREKSESGLSPSSREDKIQQLRLLHQQKHRERQGVYPQDDKEEHIERHLQSFEKQKPPPDVPPSPDRYGSHGMLPPPRRQPMPERPERTHSVQDTDRYSHYANIEEIRQQLRRHDYLQQQHRFQAAMTRQQQGPPNPRGLPPPAPTAGGGGGSASQQQLKQPPAATGRSQPNSRQASGNYADPRQLRTMQQSHQLYSQSYGPDSKGWAGYHGSGRSLTPAPISSSSSSNINLTARTASPSPTRPRGAQAPGYSPGYHHQHHHQQQHNQSSSPHSRTTFQAPGRPTYASASSNVSAHQTADSAYFNPQQRHYSSEYDVPGAHSYSRERVENSSYPHEPHFGSLPRRREQQYSNNSRGGQGLGLMSSSAQV